MYIHLYNQLTSITANSALKDNLIISPNIFNREKRIINFYSQIYSFNTHLLNQLRLQFCVHTKRQERIRITSKIFIEDQGEGGKTRREFPDKGRPAPNTEEFRKA